MSAAIQPCLFNCFAAIWNHACSCKLQILLRLIQICYVRSVVPVLLTSLCLVWSGFSSIVSMPAFHKVCPISVRVACMSGSLNVLVAILPSQG